jgi:hypothetical protein
MIHIQQTTLIHAPIHRCFDLSRSVEIHLLANIHSGAQTLAIAGITSGLVGLHQRVTWRAKHFGLWHNLTTETTALDAPTFLQVTMTQGIFRTMQTDHHFRALTPTLTEMKNIFRVAAPLAVLGPLAEALFLRRYMLALLRERNHVIQRVAESTDWQRYLLATPEAQP